MKINFIGASMAFCFRAVTRRFALPLFYFSSAMISSWVFFVGLGCMASWTATRFLMVCEDWILCSSRTLKRYLSMSVRIFPEYISVSPDSRDLWPWPVMWAVAIVEMPSSSSLGSVWLNSRTAPLQSSPDLSRAIRLKSPDTCWKLFWAGRQLPIGLEPRAEPLHENAGQVESLLAQGRCCDGICGGPDRLV
jgi:hypothetical protein